LYNIHSRARTHTHIGSYKGLENGGQEVEPPVRKYEKLAPVIGGIKVRLGQVSLI